MTQWIYDWPQIIRDLQADAYTEEGKQEVRKAAESLCDEIPRGDDGLPEDTLLASRCRYFYSYIEDLCAARTSRDRAFYAVSARSYLRRIKEREAELLREKQP